MKKLLIVLFGLFSVLNFVKAENLVFTGVVDICDLDSIACTKIDYSNNFIKYLNFGKNFLIVSHPEWEQSKVYYLSNLPWWFRYWSFSISSNSWLRWFETSAFTIKDLSHNRLYNLVISQSNYAKFGFFDWNNFSSDWSDLLGTYTEPVRINYYSWAVYFIFHSLRSWEESKYQALKIDFNWQSPIRTNNVSFCDFDSIKLSDWTCEFIGSSLSVDSDTFWTLSVDSAWHTLLFWTKNFVSLIPDRYFEPWKSKTNFFVDYNTNFIDNGYSMQQGKYVFPWFSAWFNLSVNTYWSIGLDYSGGSVVYSGYTIFPDWNWTNDVILQNVFGLDDMDYGSGVNQWVIFNRDNYKYNVSFYPYYTLSWSKVSSKDYTKLYYEEYQVENTDLQSSSVLQNNWSNNWNTNWWDNSSSSPYTSNEQELSAGHNEWNIPYIFSWQYYNSKNQLFLPYYSWDTIYDYDINSNSLVWQSQVISWFNSYNKAWFGWLCMWTDSNYTRCDYQDFVAQKEYEYHYPITWNILYFFQNEWDFANDTKRLCFVDDSYNTTCILPSNISNPIVKDVSNVWWDLAKTLGSSWTLQGLVEVWTGCPVSMTWSISDFLNFKVWWFKILWYTTPSYEPLKNFVCLWNLVEWSFDSSSVFNIWVNLSSWNNVIDESNWWNLNNYHWPSFGDVIIWLVIFSLIFYQLFWLFGSWDVETSSWWWFKKWFTQKSLRSRKSVSMPAGLNSLKYKKK